MKHIYIIVSILFSIIITSCKSNDPAPNNSRIEKAPISVHLHSYIGANEVELYNTVYRTDDNRKISLSFAQLYISNIKLVRLDGTLYEIGDTILLINITDQVYELGNVPVGNYKSIQFDVGLPSTINAQAPSGNGNLNDHAMWFSHTVQANNYIFMHASGKIDTTAAKNATEANMVPFIYKVGTNNNLVHVSMPNQTVSVQPNTMAFIHMKADYAELFEGVDLTDATNLSVASIADNGTSLAIDISTRIAQIFKFEN